MLSHLSLILLNVRNQIRRQNQQAWRTGIDWAQAPLLDFVFHHVWSLEKRFIALYTRWKNGTLPKPRAPRPGQKGGPHKPRDPDRRYPSRHGWLRYTQYHLGSFASQYRHWLENTPELLEFLEAAPQARRILGPLCQMFGGTPPVTPGGTPPVPPGGTIPPVGSIAPGIAPSPCTVAPTLAPDAPPPVAGTPRPQPKAPPAPPSLAEFFKLA